MGLYEGKQRYCCKGYHDHFIEGDRRETSLGSYPKAIKALAVLLYGRMNTRYGMIAKLLNTSRTSVWVKHAGSQMEAPRIGGKIRAMECDELWHFIGSKKPLLDLESVRSRH